MLKEYYRKLNNIHRISKIFVEYPEEVQNIIEYLMNITLKGVPTLNFLPKQIKSTIGQKVAIQFYDKKKKFSQQIFLVSNLD
jgi:hypothetical protein